MIDLLLLLVAQGAVLLSAGLYGAAVAHHHRRSAGPVADDYQLALDEQDYEELRQAFLRMHAADDPYHAVAASSDLRPASPAAPMAEQWSRADIEALLRYHETATASQPAAPAGQSARRPSTQFKSAPKGKRPSAGPAASASAAKPSASSSAPGVAPFSGPAVRLSDMHRSVSSSARPSVSLPVDDRVHVVRFQLPPGLAPIDTAAAASNEQPAQPAMATGRTISTSAVPARGSEVIRVQYVDSRMAPLQRVALDGSMAPRAARPVAPALPVIYESHSSSLQQPVASRPDSVPPFQSAPPSRPPSRPPPPYELHQPTFPVAYSPPPPPPSRPPSAAGALLPPPSRPPSVAGPPQLPPPSRPPSVAGPPPPYRPSAGLGFGWAPPSA